jgi:thiol:disulfide interchange protein DsbD
MRLLLALALALGLAAPARAEGTPKATDLVEYDKGKDVQVAPGGTAHARLTFKVDEGWHVNAHVPHDDFLVPTTLTLQAAGGVSAGTVVYPKPVEAKLQFSESPLAVYEGTFVVEVPLRAARDAAQGEHELQGVLRFQSCNDQICLPPAQIAFHVDVKVEGEPAALPATASTPQKLDAPEPKTTAVTPAPVATTAPVGDAEPLSAAPPAGAAAPATGSGDLVGNWFAERGTLLAFLLIFLMGLALNLTPCVYPMMGVTISLFGGGGGGGGMKALPRALVYVLGIALMYSTLGVVAAMTGGLFGGWLSNPWVLGGIGLLLVAMALSMFGLYELTAPSGLLTRLGGAAGASLFGTFLAGLLVGVFAAPCIGPPIIALLAFVGSKGDPLFGFWAFFVLSLGLGLPYLVLGVSTGLLTRLPRSGSWMDWVKHLFGVILLGVGAFYLCLAVAPSKLAYVVPAALGLGGLYLGFLEPTGRDRAGFRRFKWAIGVAGIVAAALVAFRAPRPAVEWEAYSADAVAQAKAAGRPVILDFSADWCVPCHELDQNTFSDRAVAEGLAPFTRLKVDFTHAEAAENVALRDRYAIEGVPTIVFLGPDGQEVRNARVYGFLGPKPFLEKVRAARAAAALAER